MSTSDVVSVPLQFPVQWKSRLAQVCGCRVDGTWAMEVELDALEGVSVANTSVKLLPTAKLNAKMLDRAVIVGGAVEVPITTAEVPNPSSPLIPPVLSIQARALSGQRKVTKVCHKRRGIY